MGYLVDSRLAQGEEWTEEDAVTYRKELSKIAQFHLDNEDFLPGAIFTRYYTDVLSEQPATKFCGTGTNMWMETVIHAICLPLLSWDVTYGRS